MTEVCTKSLVLATIYTLSLTKTLIYQNQLGTEVQLQTEITNIVDLIHTPTKVNLFCSNYEPGYHLSLMNSVI